MKISNIKVISALKKNYVDEIIEKSWGKNVATIMYTCIFIRLGVTWSY